MYAYEEFWIFLSCRAAGHLPAVCSSGVPLGLTVGGPGPGTDRQGRTQRLGGGGASWELLVLFWERVPSRLDSSELFPSLTQGLPPGGAGACLLGGRACVCLWEGLVRTPGLALGSPHPQACSLDTAFSVEVKFTKPKTNRYKVCGLVGFVRMYSSYL